MCGRIYMHVGDNEGLHGSEAMYPNMCQYSSIVKINSNCTWISLGSTDASEWYRMVGFPCHHSHLITSIIQDQLTCNKADLIL